MQKSLRVFFFILKGPKYAYMAQVKSNKEHHRNIFAQFPQAAPSLWLFKIVCMVKSLIRSNLCDDPMYLFCFSSQRTNDTTNVKNFLTIAREVVRKCVRDTFPFWWNVHYKSF